MFRQPPRRIFAVIAAAFPVIVEIAITGVWWERLPDRIATSFGPDGSPTGYGTPLGTAILFAALQAPFLAAAIGSAWPRCRSRDRCGPRSSRGGPRRVRAWPRSVEMDGEVKAARAVIAGRQEGPPSSKRS